MQSPKIISHGGFLVLSSLLLGALSSCDNSKCLEIKPIGKPVVAPTNKVSLTFRVMYCGTEEPAGLIDIAHFKILENGKETSDSESRKRFLPQAESYRAVLSLYLDVSGSVLRTLESLKTAAAQAVKTFLPSSDAGTMSTRQVSVTAFSGYERVFPLGTAGGESGKTADQLVSAINAIHCSDPILPSDPDYCKLPSTNLYGAVKTGAEDLDSTVMSLRNGRIAIVEGSLVTFTDGRDRANWATSTQAKSALDSTKAKISSYTIGLGTEIEPDMLKLLGKDGFFPVLQASELAQTFQNVIDQILARANSVYVLEYCSPIYKGDVEMQLKVDDEGRTGSEFFHFVGTTNGQTCELFR